MFSARRLVTSVIAKQRAPISPLRQLSSSAALLQLNLKGIYPPISTPFTSDGKLEIDFDKLAMNMEFYDKSPLRG